MAKPSDELSDDDLHQGLASGEYKEQDALIAKEILRRRHEERIRTGKHWLGRIGAVAAALLLWIKVRLGRRKDQLTVGLLGKAMWQCPRRELDRSKAFFIPQPSPT